ncbi:MAG: ATP-dependent DNA helicase [Euryarchaeota archaeon]|nr:ATP-dependent DNA helicase [Euryarchaeota archaeon]
MAKESSLERIVRTILHEYFPYERLRPGQEKIMEAVVSSVLQRRPLLINAETGVGKTVAVLTPLYYFAEERGFRIFYTTRTLSQSTQALLEFERISRKSRSKLSAMSFQGRLGLCPMVFLDKRFEENVDYDEFRAICEKLRDFTRKEEFRRIKEYEFVSKMFRSLEDLRLAERALYSTCPYYFGYLTTENNLNAIKPILSKVLYPDVVFEECLSRVICPYEVLKDFAKSATMIVLPYIYIFNPRIRQVFLRGVLEVFERDLEGFILVVDEAHNLPDYLRDLLSSRISLVTIKRAMKEVKDLIEVSKELSKYSKIEIMLDKDIHYLSLRHILKSLENTLIDCAEEYLHEESVEISLYTLLEKFYYYLFKDTLFKEDTMATSDDTLMCYTIEIIAYNLAEIGNIIREHLLKAGFRPRSYIGRIGDFLTGAFILKDDFATHFFLERIKNNIALRISNFNTQTLSEIIKTFYTSIHMSGTLKPFDSYKVDIGLENTIEIDIPVEFIRRNRLVFYYSKVTTKYDTFLKDPERIITSIKRALMSLIENVSANTIVLFPSYEWLDRIMDEDFLLFLEKTRYGRYFIESKDKSIRQIQKDIETFKKLKDLGCVFFGVFGGRLSEGVDFPHEELRILVLVGLPYPKPDALQKALYRYYEARYGSESAWYHAFEVPMIRKVLQAIGRLVRDEYDYGIAIILDSRAKRLKALIQPLLEKNTLTDLDEWLIRLKMKALRGL